MNFIIRVPVLQCAVAFSLQAINTRSLAHVTTRLMAKAHDEPEMYQPLAIILQSKYETVDYGIHARKQTISSGSSLMYKVP